MTHSSKACDLEGKMYVECRRSPVGGSYSGSYNDLVVGFVDTYHQSFGEKGRQKAWNHAAEVAIIIANEVLNEE